MRQLEEPEDVKTKETRKRLEQLTLPPSCVYCAEKIATQELDCIPTRKCVNYGRTKRGCLQHHSPGTEDGLTIIQV